VASVVGLLSAEIFGYTNRQTLKYAHDLGLAFQLTNIIRDVGEDARRGRIYLPIDELQRFNVPARQILDGQYSDNFRELMAFQAARARQLYDQAFAQLPAEDRKAQRPGLIMAAIYRTLLDEIEADGFLVLDRRTSSRRCARSGSPGAPGSRDDPAPGRRGRRRLRRLRRRRHAGPRRRPGHPVRKLRVLGGRARVVEKTASASTTASTSCSAPTPKPCACCAWWASSPACSKPAGWPWSTPAKPANCAPPRCPPRCTWPSACCAPAASASPTSSPWRG
jgi:hypothetical protein